MLLNRQLPSFTGVPASLTSGQTGITATCKLNLGEKIHAIWLRFSTGDATSNVGIGTVAARTLVGNIRLKINGKTVREHSAQELNAINSAMGSIYAAKTSGTSGNITTAPFKTCLPIFLAEPWREGVVNLGGVQVPESMLSAIDLVGIESASLEVDLEGTIAGASGAVTAPSVSGFYEYEPSNQPIQSIVKWSRQLIGVSGTPAEISTLDKLRGAYQSIHLFATSDNKFVSSIKFTRNSVEVRNDIDRFQNDAILLARKLSPVTLDTTSSATIQNTGLYNLVFDYDDPIRNALVVAPGGRPVNELTMKPSFSNLPTLAAVAPSGNLVVISQITGELD